MFFCDKSRVNKSLLESRIFTTTIVDLKLILKCNNNRLLRFKINIFNITLSVSNLSL